MKTPARRPRSAFSLIELLVVIAIILILLGLIIPLSRIAREKSNLVTCAHNMKSINAGLLAHPTTNDGYLPWAGNVDRNWKNDWVWGGQSKADLNNPGVYKSAAFGFHPEAGIAYPLVSGLPRILKTESNIPNLQTAAPSKGAPYEDTLHNEMEHKMYRCPSTGDLGKALRVNFSMNDAYDTQWGDGNTDPNRNAVSATSWGDMKWRAQRSKFGVRLSTLKGPSHKIMLVNEDPFTMLNASFAPGGTADDVMGAHVTHDGKINVGFADGHIGQNSGDFMFEIQKTSVISPDGKLNNVQYWFAPAD